MSQPLILAVCSVGIASQIHARLPADCLKTITCFFFLDIAVLTTEGEITSKIFFIKSGTCQQWKKLSVAFTYPDGKKVHFNKRIILHFAIYSINYYSHDENIHC